MSKINLYSDKNTTTTSVSNVFIDEYMSGANGEFVKIYLYLLRRLNAADAGFSLSEIADKFEHTEGDVKRALCYWERMQLLRLDYDTNENLVGIQLKDALSKTDNPSPVTATAETCSQDTKSEASGSSDALNQSNVPAKKSYSADDIKQFTEQEAVTELVFIAEQYLGKTLTITDLNTIFYFYDGLKLSVELIEYLIEYCVSNGHSSMHYIEKVAINWSANEYKTVEQVKLANEQYNQTHFSIMKAMGITKRSLVSSEIDYINKWVKDFGFSLEMIKAACEKTIVAINEPNFKYADKILSDWNTNHFTTLEQVAKADSEHQKRKKTAPAIQKTVSTNKFNNFEQRSYDYDNLEKMLLTSSVQ